MKQYLIGIDNGGSDIKCAVFDLEGNELSAAHTQVRLNVPKPGYTERDANEVWEANVKVIREAVEKSHVREDEVAAIGLTGYGNGVVLVDEHYKAVYPVIVSTDDRADEYCRRFQEDGTERAMFPYTRQEIWAAQPAALLPWFRDNMPEVLKKTRWIMSIKDYIRLRLTGEVAGEVTDASSGCLVNLNTRNYERELFRILDIEDCFEKMPPVLESTQISGYVTKEAAKQIKIAAGVPVAAGYFDIDANALASGVLSSDVLCLIAGTWSINEYLSKEAPDEYCNSTATLSYLKDNYLIEDSSPTSASNFNWILHQIFTEEQLKMKKDDIYDECNKLVESVPPQRSSAVFVPYLYGSATHPDAKGAFLNLTGADDRGTMLCAVYEGVVFSTRHHVRNLGRELSSYKIARLSGGVSNSSVWSQMMSDVMQIPIETLEDEEPGAKGAAMGAGVACGIFSGLEDAAYKMVHFGKVYYPRPEYGAIYEKKYRRYEAALWAVDRMAEQL